MKFFLIWMQKFRIDYGINSIYLYIRNYEKGSFSEKTKNIQKDNLTKIKIKISNWFSVQKNIAFQQKSA